MARHRDPASPSKTGFNQVSKGHPMSVSVDNALQVKFLNNAELMLQQHKSKIWEHAVPVDVAGSEKAKIKDFFGNRTTQTGDDRHGDTRYSEATQDGLWLPKRPEEYSADLVDRGDQQATNINIGSGYMMSHTSAINRFWDDVCLAALYGSLISGKTGTTVTALGSGMTVPVTEGGASGAQGMNLEKLEAAGQLLDEAYNDPDEEKFVILPSKFNRQLRREIKATSSDFASLGGRIDPRTGLLVAWNGWNIIPFELANTLLKLTYGGGLYLDGSGYFKLPYWKKSGLAKGVWELLYPGVDRLPAKRYSTQYFLGTTVNATRTQAGKSGLILCSAS